MTPHISRRTLLSSHRGAKKSWRQKAENTCDQRWAEPALFTFSVVLCLRESITSRELIVSNCEKYILFRAFNEYHPSALFIVLFFLSTRYSQCLLSIYWIGSLLPKGSCRGPVLKSGKRGLVPSLLVIAGSGRGRVRGRRSGCCLAGENECNIANPLLPPDMNRQKNENSGFSLPFFLWRQKVMLH